MFLLLAFAQVKSQVPNWAWAKSAGGTANEIPHSVVTDAFGNVYIAGFFESSSVTFGTTTLNNAGNYDIFIAKYDANGNAIWAKRAGGSGIDIPRSLAIDDSGNIYMTGIYGSYNIAFGSFLLNNAGNYDMFVVKYDTNGNVIWASRAGGTSDDEAYSVACDHFGNIYVVGFFESNPILFGTVSLNNSTPGVYRDIFIVKYDLNGNVLWAKSEGGNSYDHANSVATDSFGNVFMTGYFWSSSITFGTTTFFNSGSSSSSGDVFTIKYNSSGNVIWAKQAGGIYRDQGSSVATDAAGNVYVTGFFYGNFFSFGSTTLNGAGTWDDMFILKYDLNGNEQWAKSAGGILQDEATGVVVDGAGNVYVAGFFLNPFIAFDTDTIWNTLTGGDIFIVKYDSSGNVLWVKGAGGTQGSAGGADYAYGIAVNNQGNVYIAGLTRCESIPFGNDTLYNSGNWDVILAKLDTTLSVGIQATQDPYLEFLIYPNPTTSKFTVETGNNYFSEITLFDLFSKTVMRKQFVSHAFLDVEHLAKGIYIYEVRNKNGVIKKGKVVKD